MRACGKPAPRRLTIQARPATTRIRRRHVQMDPSTLKQAKRRQKGDQVMKQVPALVAALAITAIIGLCMLGVGINALANRNTAPLLTTPSAAGSGTSAISGMSAISATGDTVRQLEARINQYQSREQQYQTQLSQLEQQLNQEGQTIQNFQQLLGALQAQGVILIQQDGTILIPRR
jgi:hypothetical protein